MINIAFLIGLNLLVKPFWIFGIDRTIQNEVGSEEYGLYFALFNFSYLFHTLLDLGITNFNNWSVARNASFIGLQYKKLASLKLLLGIIYLVITLSLGVIMGFDERSFHLLSILCASQFLLSYLMFLRSNIAGLQIFWLDSLVSVADRILMIIICSYLLFGPGILGAFRIEWLAYSQLGTYLGVVFIVQLIFWLHKNFYAGFESISLIEIKSVFKESLPFALIILFMTLYHRLDAIMLQQILSDGDYQSGVYAQGYRIFDVLNNFTFLFVGILFPLLSRMLANKVEVGPVMSTAVKLLFVPAVALCALALFYSQEIMSLLYVDLDEQSGMILILLITSFIPLIATSIWGTCLTANGSLKKMIWLTGFGALLNLGLNFILIPQHGATGAAFATLISQSLIGLGSLFLLVNLNLVRLVPKDFPSPIFLTGGSILVAWLLNRNGMDLYTATGGLMVFNATLVLTIKWVSLEDIAALLRNKKA